MSKQTIFTGSAPGDGTGDPNRTCWTKANENFTELYDIGLSNKTDNHTLALADNLKMVTVTKSSACTLTVPPNSSVAFPVGTMIILVQGGTGQLSVVAGNGVTINSYNAALDLSGQFASATLVKTATNTWLLTGQIE
jgi:hypothetical protein